MPVLDAKALKSDPDGLAFLRDVLRPAAGAERSAAAPQEPVRLRRNAFTVSAPAPTAEPPRAP